MPYLSLAYLAEQNSSAYRLIDLILSTLPYSLPIRNLACTGLNFMLKNNDWTF